MFRLEVVSLRGNINYDISDGSEWFESVLTAELCVTAICRLLINNQCVVLKYQTTCTVFRSLACTSLIHPMQYPWVASSTLPSSQERLAVCKDYIFILLYQINCSVHPHSFPAPNLAKLQRSHQSDCRCWISGWGRWTTASPTAASSWWRCICWRPAAEAEETRPSASVRYLCQDNTHQQISD